MVIVNAFHCFFLFVNVNSFETRVSELKSTLKTKLFLKCIILINAIFGWWYSNYDWLFRIFPEICNIILKLCFLSPQTNSKILWFLNVCTWSLFDQICFTQKNPLKPHTTSYKTMALIKKKLIQGGGACCLIWNSNLIKNQKDSSFINIIQDGKFLI